MSEKFNPKVTVSEFKAEMDKNPLGDDPLVRVSGDNYIIEYYPDGIAGSQLSVWRKAKPNEDHFRKWKKVGETEDFNGNLRETYENLSPSDIRKLDN